MTNYSKVWGSAFGLLCIIFAFMLFYATSTTDRNETIYKTIQDADTTNISSILIGPSIGGWGKNLTIDTIIVTNKDTMNEILLALKGMVRKHYRRGSPSNSESYLTLIFGKPSPVKLKDKNKLKLEVYNNAEGLFIEMTNVMGFETYSCQGLEPLMATLTSNTKPQVKHR